MSFKVVLPQIVRQFRSRHMERPVDPVYFGPKDVLQLMEFVERNVNSRRSPFGRRVVFDDGAVLVPEPGFRY